MILSQDRDFRSCCLWAIARPAPGDKPLDEAELAMIAQIVAPSLAGMTPSSVHRRYEEFSIRTGTATGAKAEERR